MSLLFWLSALQGKSTLLDTPCEVHFIPWIICDFVKSFNLLYWSPQPVSSMLCNLLHVAAETTWHDGAQHEGPVFKACADPDPFCDSNVIHVPSHIL